MSDFTISEAARLSGLPDSTLRYYERIGLIEGIGRDQNSKHRVYSQSDIDRLALIACLNATGMSIENLRAYMSNRLAGAAKARQQIDLLGERKQQLDEEVHMLQLRLRYVEAKIAYWDAVERDDPVAIEACSAASYAIADEMKLPRTSRSART